MKKVLFCLLLSFLLNGCAAQHSEPEALTTPTAATAAIEPASPAADILSVNPQSSGKDGLQQYSLSEEVTGLLPLGDHLLLFSGEDATTLTLLNPETGIVEATHDTLVVLASENATVQLLEKGISYFRGDTRETVVLDHSLREVRRIAAPEDLAGFPLLSLNGKSLYYCTSNAVRCLDLDSGISRVLKETSHPVQSVTALLLEDSVVQLSVTDNDGTWHTLFLSSETGQLLGDHEGNILPKTSENAFFLCLKKGNLKTLLFGSGAEAVMMLNTPTEVEDCYFLGSQVVTTAWVDGTEALALYSLDTGLCTSSISLPSGQFSRNIVSGNEDTIWFLCDQEDQSVMLCCWKPTASQIQDDTVYAAPYYTREEPDYDGLAACSLYAQELSEKYGVEILIYRDAVATEPWDYHLEYEYQVPTIQRELERLNTHLSNFPDGFLQTLKEKYTALKICIVRSAEGSPESGSLEAVNGVQFLDGFDAYIILACDHDTEYALYHELCHLMETVVLTESVAYDRWDNLNPPNFQYDNSYTTNQNRDGSAWLKPGAEYFIDTYSMSYAKEDRARILEYAMTAGHEVLFSSPNLQAKLVQLCTGIREGFGLENRAEQFLWEQYLLTPLSPE